MPLACPGEVHLAARNEQQATFEDATTFAVDSHVPCYLLSESVVSSKREPPRGKPVASMEGSGDFFSGNERETPPAKPVASLALRSFTDMLLLLYIQKNSKMTTEV